MHPAAVRPASQGVSRIVKSGERVRRGRGRNHRGVLRAARTGPRPPRRPRSHAGRLLPQRKQQWCVSCGDGRRPEAKFRSSRCSPQAVRAMAVARTRCTKKTGDRRGIGRLAAEGSRFGKRTAELKAVPLRYESNRPRSQTETGRRRLPATVRFEPAALSSRYRQTAWHGVEFCRIAASVLRRETTTHRHRNDAPRPGSLQNGLHDTEASSTHPKGAFRRPPRPDGTHAVHCWLRCSMPLRPTERTSRHDRPAQSFERRGMPRSAVPPRHVGERSQVDLVRPGGSVLMGEVEVGIGDGGRQDQAVVLQTPFLA